MVATDAALLARLRDRRRGAADAVEGELVGIADAHEDRGLRLETSRGRHGQRLAQLPLEAGLGEERGEAAVERGVDGVGAGAELAALAHGDREELGADAVGRGW